MIEPERNTNALWHYTKREGAGSQPVRAKYECMAENNFSAARDRCSPRLLKCTEATGASNRSGKSCSMQASAVRAMLAAPATHQRLQIEGMRAYERCLHVVIRTLRCLCSEERLLRCSACDRATVGSSVHSHAVELSDGCTSALPALPHQVAHLRLERHTEVSTSLPAKCAAFRMCSKEHALQHRGVRPDSWA